MAIATPLGKDVLLLTDLRGTEGISRPFIFELDMFSENHNLTFESIIGKSATVSIALADGNLRYLNGIISRLSQARGGDLAGGDTLSHYSATLVPWLWLLSRTASSRIFQKLAVPDIIEKIFNEKGLSHFQQHLEGSYKPRDYCVQYRETDLNFVSRLMEEEGIYYFFEHEDGNHTLIMADAPAQHKPCPAQESARYQVSAGGRLEGDVITGLAKMQEIRAGQYALSDYNFEIPNTDLSVHVSSTESLGPGMREIYDYPGLYDKRLGGDRLARIRMEEEEARITTITGSSNCRAFTSGYRFLLSDHYRQDMNNKEYVMTLIGHQASQPYKSTQGSQSELSYSNHFECIPHQVKFRPRRNTPKPAVQGTQTAIVVGPSGEEIYTDEHGRVKVQFHWDREGKRDENSSCWIRVGQLWAGPGWGSLYIPRIGQEVIVDFLEGDPDRPIVIGCVYHGNNTPPYPLPNEKTKSTIKSDSSLGGGGFNELRFEDKKGKEEIFLHGQKDWTIVIEHDKNQTVGNNETLSVGVNRDKQVGSNQTEAIGIDKTITVGANHTEAIGVNKTMTVGANHTETIAANMTQTVAMNKAETIGIVKALTIGAVYQVSVGAAMNETIGAAKAEEIGAAKMVAVGANSSEEVGISKSVNAGKDVSVSAGKDISESAGKDVSVQAGKNMTLTAGDQIVIKCGSASITLKKNGDITIQGKAITIKGSGNVVIKGSKILEN